jgi:hypothetical protein
VATSKNVIPAKAGIQKPLTSLDSHLGGSDKLIIIRGCLVIIVRYVRLPVPGIILKSGRFRLLEENVKVCTVLLFKNQKRGSRADRGRVAVCKGTHVSPKSEESLRRIFVV